VFQTETGALTGKSKKWQWTGPLAVYLSTLVSLIMNQIADQAVKSFFFYVALQFLVFALPIVIILFYIKVIEKDDFWSSTGFSKTSWLKIVAFTLVLYFLSFALSASLFSAAEYFSPKLPEGTRYDPGAVQTAFRGLPRAAYWYMMFTSIVYAGFGEELTFRGYILTRLLNRGRLFAVVASALMWSSLHLWYLPTLGSTGIWQHMDVILTGLLFGVAYVRIRSIVPFIAVHALTDVFLPLSYLYPSGAVDLAAFVLLILGVISTLAVGVYWIYRHFTRGSQV
jgi:membrane protease YdiL (CAAX protease family)